MSRKVMLKIPMNRVEGDLEILVQVEDGRVTDAWSSGLMYRGFENLLIGRAPLDGLVITPRICGICGTAHLMAAAKAIEMMCNITPPPAAIKLRNVALMTEKIQSDLRHGFLMFAPDFINTIYSKVPFYDQAVERYTPLKGRSAIEVIKETKRLVEIIAIIGGQWPHSSYMIPGGVTAMPSSGELLQCRHILNRFKNWYEKRILGCSIERWQSIKSISDLDAWLEEDESHRLSEIGFFTRFSRHIGLEKIGKGHSNFLGACDVNGTDLQGLECLESCSLNGFAQGTTISSFDETCITEDVSHSWYLDTSAPVHPFSGTTQPYATGQESKKYSWAKAPRYNNLPAETGPLALMIISNNPLFMDYFQSHGHSAFLREFARLLRPATLIPAIDDCLVETSEDQVFYVPTEDVEDGHGIGLVDATRGLLGHWVVIKDGQIQRYQIITPTAWNASPRDINGIRGPWEQALIGTPVEDPSNPVKLGHVIRSYDACLFCTVHMVDVE